MRIKSTNNLAEAFSCTVEFGKITSNCIEKLLEKEDTTVHDWGNGVKTIKFSSRSYAEVLGEPTAEVLDYWLYETVEIIER